MAVPTRSARLYVHNTTLIIATSDRLADEKGTLSGDWHPSRRPEGARCAGLPARRQGGLVLLATPSDASGHAVGDHTFYEGVHDEGPRTDDSVGADRPAVDHLPAEGEISPVPDSDATAPGRAPATAPSGASRAGGRGGARDRQVGGRAPEPAGKPLVRAGKPPPPPPPPRTPEPARMPAWGARTADG